MIHNRDTTRAHSITVIYSFFLLIIDSDNKAVQWHCAKRAEEIFERKHQKSSRNFSSIVNK